MKKSSDKEAAKKEEVHSMEELILNYSKDRYKLTTLALRWAQEIRVRDNLNDPPQQILSQALKEILTGKVKLSEIEKLKPIPKDKKGKVLSIKGEKSEDSKEKSPKTKK